MNELQLYIDTNKPLIIGIAEVKPKHYRFSPNLAAYSIPGYHMFHKNVTNNIGRGVLLYIHNSLEPNEVIMSDVFEEYICAEIKLQGNDSMLITIIYRSDSGTQCNNDELLKLLESVSTKQYTHKLIMGDFNYKHIDWDHSSTSLSDASNEHNFIECVRDCYLHQHIREPTRCRIGQTPSTIDLVFSNEEGMVSDIKHLSPLGKSDHCVLSFKFNRATDCNTAFKPRFLYNKGDYASISKYLDIDWEEEFKRADTCEEQWKILVNHLRIARENWVPLQTSKPKWRDKGKFPLDKNCIRKKNKKHRSWQRYIETKEDDKWKEYCKHRNQVRKMTR